MKIDAAHKGLFDGYFTPLGLLELALRKAGVEVSFEGTVDAHGNRIINLIEPTTLRKYRSVCIEDDSPGQAIKDVVENIRLN
jgi:hypothetical protein